VIPSPRPTIVLLLLLALAAGCGDNEPRTTGPTFTGPEKPFHLSAHLSTAQVIHTPKRAKGASGTFFGTIKPFGNSGILEWRLTYRGLTGRATAANLFLGRSGTKGVVAIDLCAPCSPNAHGSIGANADLLQAVLGRPAYVEVDTTRNPRGEIRGSVNVARPSPGN
jgi:CHRD domain